MATVNEIIERALKYLNDPDWEFHEALVMRLALELASPLEQQTIDSNA